MTPANLSTAADRRCYVRPAARILATLVAANGRRTVVRLPEETWEECREIVRRLRDAESRDWQAAAAQIRRNLTSPLESLIYSLQESAKAITVPPDEPATMNLRSIVDELAALENEFSDFGFDLEEHRVWVVTDEIELEGVALGRFRIVLNWARLGDDYPYEVQAEDPNPATNDSSVTHPHVRDDRLCEGDGKAAIRTALAEGRLFDFFVLVRQILGTYNPSSAYVRLCAWAGIGCCDCGNHVSADESTCCERCESDLCYDCSQNCPDCGRTYCGECSSCCQGCGDGYCRGCLSSCDGCNDSFCNECLMDGLCASCHETPEETDDPVQPKIVPTTTPAAPDAHLPADGVGEVNVLA